MHTIWIDKRDLEAAPKVGNKSSYRGAAIYRNISRDGGATFGPDTKVADHSCECCRIALGVGQRWRPCAPCGAMCSSPMCATTPLPCCAAEAPVDVGACHLRRVAGGWLPAPRPGLAQAADGFHTVWFGIRQEGDDKVSGVRYARLALDGTPRLQTVRTIPDARAEHADVAAQGERVAVVWRSTDGMTSTLKAWISADGGQTFREQALGQVDGDNDFPRLVQQGQRMVVVWRNAAEVRVHEIKF